MLQLLTTTGARPVAWALCMKWMDRQDYTGPVRWVIVDDGPTPQQVPKRAGWQIEVVRPKALWKPGMNTQMSNLRAGMRRISNEHPLAIIEDDDAYAPGYLSRIVKELKNHEMVGQRLCRKYNLRTRRAASFDHAYRASLCATAVRGHALIRLREVVRAGSPRLIDGIIWRPGRGHLFDGAYVTGMKCLPGRSGIDSGHRDQFGDIKDPDGSVLRQWLGNDAEEYLSMQISPTREGEIQQYAAAYKSPVYRMGDRRRADVIKYLKTLGKGTLLDVGTGRGETLGFAQAAGLDARGTEVVGYLLNDRVTYAEAHSLPFADGQFDHVTCFDVLEHLTEPDIRPALTEMLRVARVSVAVSASERSDIRNGRELHISKRPKAKWLELIRRCWGPDAVCRGTAGASPLFTIKKTGQV